jgi:hypothetical protein
MLHVRLTSFTAKKSFSVPEEWIQPHFEKQDRIPGERDAHIPIKKEYLVYQIKRV